MVVRPGRAHAAVQGPPPFNTAPRVLRKPPLDELGRIAKAYDLDLSAEDLTSFRTLMDGVLASYRRLDQFAEPTLPVKYPRNAGYRPPASEDRSEEHTSELQSLAYLVCRLLLEKKKKHDRLHHHCERQGRHTA